MTTKHYAQLTAQDIASCDRWAEDGSDIVIESDIHEAIMMAIESAMDDETWSETVTIIGYTEREGDDVDAEDVIAQALEVIGTSPTRDKMPAVVMDAADKLREMVQTYWVPSAYDKRLTVIVNVVEYLAQHDETMLQEWFAQ